jgi:hypothetical protein
MALYYDLPVFKEVYKLILLIYSLTKYFSKEEKLSFDRKRGSDFLFMRFSNKTRQTQLEFSGVIVVGYNAIVGNVLMFLKCC